MYLDMADVHTHEQRSFNMQQIKGKDTKPEMLVRKFLHANGFRYKLHDKTLPGKPDIVLPKYKTVIFVHGCFWHGHEGCKYLCKFDGMETSNTIRKSLNSKGAHIFKKRLDDKKAIQLHLRNGGRLKDLKNKYSFVKPFPTPRSLSPLNISN